MQTEEKPAVDQGENKTTSEAPAKKSNKKKIDGNIVAVVIAILVLGVGMVLYAQEDGATAQVSQANSNKGSVKLATSSGSSAASNSTSETSTATTSDSAAAQGVAEGDQAPAWTLPTTDGTSVNLADFQGTPTLLTFEATWCTFCQREHPDLERLNAEYGDQLQVVTIYLGEDSLTVSDADTERGTERLTLVDQAGDAGLAYGASGTPTHVFLNSDHTVSLYRPGLMTYDQLTEAVSALN